MSSRALSSPAGRPGPSAGCAGQAQVVHGCAQRRRWAADWVLLYIGGRCGGHKSWALKQAQRMLALTALHGRSAGCFPATAGGARWLCQNANSRTHAGWLEDIGSLVVALPCSVGRPVCGCLVLMPPPAGALWPRVCARLAGLTRSLQKLLHGRIALQLSLSCQRLGQVHCTHLSVSTRACQVLHLGWACSSMSGFWLDLISRQRLSQH